MPVQFDIKQCTRSKLVKDLSFWWCLTTCDNLQLFAALVKIVNDNIKNGNVDYGQIS